MEINHSSQLFRFQFVSEILYLLRFPYHYAITFSSSFFICTSCGLEWPHVQLSK